MNTYRVRFASGLEFEREASDMRALLTVLVAVERMVEPVSIVMLDEYGIEL